MLERGDGITFMCKLTPSFSLHSSQLRKCMCEIRNHFPNVSNSSAFLALAEAYGSVEEACAKLSNEQFLSETRLVGKVIDVGSYLVDFVDDDDDISLGSRGGSNRAVSKVGRSSRGGRRGGRWGAVMGEDAGAEIGDGARVFTSPGSMASLPNIGVLNRLASIGRRVPTAEGKRRTRQSQSDYMSALANPQLKSNRKSPVDLMVEHFSPERQNSPAVSVKLGGIIRSTQWGVNERAGKMKVSRSKLVTAGGSFGGVGGLGRGRLREGTDKLFSPVKAITLS